MKNPMKLEFPMLGSSLLSLAFVGIISAGCVETDPQPPASPPAEVFSPADGHIFNASGGQFDLINLDTSDVVGGVVCVTLDGTDPVYNGGTCNTGGGDTGFPYPGPGALGFQCDSVAPATGPTLVSNTVKAVFQWDNGVDAASEELRSATYTLDCTEYAIFGLSGSGAISGATTGTTSALGFARLNELTGVLQLQYTSDSVTGFTDTTTVSQGAIYSASAQSGGWINPILSDLVSSVSIVDCTNNGGFINGCDNIVLNNPAPMGINEASITFDLTQGGITQFTTQTVSQVTIDTTWTLIAQ